MNLKDKSTEQLLQDKFFKRNRFTLSDNVWEKMRLKREIEWIDEELERRGNVNTNKLITKR